MKIKGNLVHRLGPGIAIHDSYAYPGGDAHLISFIYYIQTLCKSNGIEKLGPQTGAHIGGALLGSATVIHTYTTF